MALDFWIVLQWWGTLFLVGAMAYPLTKKLFGPTSPRLRGAPFSGMDNSRRDIASGRATRSSDVVESEGWFDHGYFFAKAVGMATVTWIVYVLGTLRVMPFSVLSIGVAITAVFLLGIGFHKGDKGDKGDQGSWGIIIIEEVFFLAALLFWSWIKGHEPSIRGLEKFMDYGFMQSILNSQFFPPADMWYAGSPINYYYFGHIVVAVLTRLSGLDLAYTFNLMLATIFALTLTMSFSIGKQIGGRGGGMLTAFLVTLAGNMQTIYAFTKGYTGENVKPFWELGWKIRDIGEIGDFGGFWGKLGEGMNTYWYANATRFIPYTIHEFPSYSFVVSDVHGHVLSIPFVLLAIAILIKIFFKGDWGDRGYWGRIIFYGFLVGVLLMTNALDGPIYFALFALLLVVVNWSNGRWQKILQLGIVGAVTVVTSLPFLIHFKSFVTGVAVNCPPAFLANTKFGPLIFEGVEKCQISPLWMWWLLWGFFIYCGGWLVGRRIRGIRGIREIRVETLLIIFFVVALVLVIVPEFFYFKDIYPAHFRSNTMFKLGYQAFILFSIVAGYTIVASLKFKIQNSKFKILRALFLIILLPQLFLVSIFPIFAVRSYFNSLKTYQGIYGLNWISREYPDDFAAIQWLNNNSPRPPKTNPTLPPLKVRGGEEGLRGGNGGVTRFALVEADGDSYTDYGRFSAFTGMPTIIGWPVHEWLWRGSYDVVAPRREEVRIIYESEDIESTRMILNKYKVHFIVVGKLEREKYKSLAEWKFSELGAEVFRSGSTVIYGTY